MHLWLEVTAIGIALVSAVRSTWSPCGLSMLASITPMSEQGRGHRYRTTAAWFVAGATVGGATLGAVMALLAVAVDAAGPSGAVAVGLGALSCAVALASDVGWGGFRLPVHHRQVNERWLDQFRPWVYGAGFGWQIGSGLTTYIMTAAVYLMMALGALTAAPWVALGLGLTFGLVRGLAVLLGRRITGTDSLRAFHVRFSAWGPRWRRVMLVAEWSALVVLGGVLAPWAVPALVVVTVAAVGHRRLRTKGTRPVGGVAVSGDMIGSSGSLVEAR